MPKVLTRKPAIAPQNLTPFKSLLVATFSKVSKADHITAGILPQVRDLASGKWLKSGSDIAGPFDDPRVHVSFFTYTEERPPSWARLSDLRDIANHVVIACRGKSKAAKYVAFYFSDGALRDKAAEAMAKKDGALGALETIPPGRMNAAYVAAGQAITLWMSGTHRRVPTRVDNKVISGMDLQYALDPLEDQSFFFTAARSRLSGDKLAQPIGSSPRRSRIWLGPSSDWADFSAAVGTLLDLLVGATTPISNPLPVLAGPVDAAAFGAVADAYDVALIPPELLDPSASTPERLEERERLAAVALEPFGQHGADFSVRVASPPGTALGTFDLAFSLAAGGRAHWDAANALATANHALFEDVVSAVTTHRAWLKVWYDTGHTLADESFFEGRFRDQAFPDYAWVSFTGFDVTKEKPSPLNAATIGAQDSLFCWVRQRWVVPGSASLPGRGWLACDDGAMEKADFLHIDLTQPPTLSLIHVKASKSGAATRPISVADYEIVTSQAVKNLRWIDQATLAGGLAGRLAGRISNKVWLDGAPSTAASFLTAVQALGSNYRRNVVVLQPRARRMAVDHARSAPKDSAEHLRMMQLDALLLGARANVLGLGATFNVVGDNS